MATPFDVQLAQLPADERAEIIKLLAEQSRAVWCSDEGDGLAFHLLAAVAAVAGIVAAFTEVSPAELLAFFTSLPDSLSGFDPAILGILLATLVLALILWRFLVLHKRHGWLVASFGYMRVRGPSLRLVRWSDITRVHRRAVGSGRSRFVMVDLTTAKGTLECDTAIFFSDIKRHVPATATIEE